MGGASVVAEPGAGWNRRLWLRVQSEGSRGWRLRRVSRATMVHRVAPAAVLVALMGGYAVYYGMWSLRKFDAFQAPAFDMGIFDQGVWLLSRFKEPFVTVLGLNLFGDHISFVMLAFVPLYWVCPGPETLLVVQAMALAVGAVPVYLLARTVLRSHWLALVPSAAYLLTPALGWLNLENFHPDSLEVPLLLFALYFMTRGRWRAYLVMVLLLMTVKEDVVLLLVPLGFYVALYHNRRMGLLTSGMSMAWFMVVFFLVQPVLSGAPPGSLDTWRIPFGGFGGLAKTALLRPWEVIAYMLSVEKVKYLFQLLTPVLFLPLLSARTLVILPVVFFNLISNFWYQSNIQYHYHSLITPVLSVMALVALAARFRSTKVRRVLAVVMLVATVFSLYMWGPVQGSRAPSYYPDPQHPQAVAAAEAVALIPPSAVVAAEDKFAAHLTSRQQIYVFPTPFKATYWGDDSQKGRRLPAAEEVEYVLVMPSYLGEGSARLYASLPEEGFATIYDKMGVVVLQRDPGLRDQSE